MKPINPLDSYNHTFQQEGISGLIAFVLGATTTTTGTGTSLP